MRTDIHHQESWEELESRNGSFTPHLSSAQIPSSPSLFSDLRPQTLDWTGRSAAFRQDPGAERFQKLRAQKLPSLIRWRLFQVSPERDKRFQTCVFPAFGVANYEATGYGSVIRY